MTEEMIDTFGQNDTLNTKEELLRKIDRQAGFIRLYDDQTINDLVKCYIEWPKLPDKQDVELMVNGGCIFYQFGQQPYVYGLGLKEGNIGKVLTEDDINQLIPWFSRFSDLLTRTSYRQQWYKDILTMFELEEQPYIKSFFTILANLAFGIQNYKEPEFIALLRYKFKVLLQFEIDRDYKKELDDQLNFQSILEQIKKQNDQQSAESDIIIQKDEGSDDIIQKNEESEQSTKTEIEPRN